MTKFEYRLSIDDEANHVLHRIGHSGFVILSSFVIGHSTFHAVFPSVNFMNAVSMSIASD